MESLSQADQAWLRVARGAKERHQYDFQNIYLCRHCGFIYIDPVLSDKEMITLIFEASNLSLEPLSRHRWSYPESRGAPSLWSTAVRVPSINDSLRPFLDKPVRVLDVGSHGGEISLNLDLPKGSQVDLLQLENAFAAASPGSHLPPNARQFSGLLMDLADAEPEYRADVILALAVFEHVDSPRKFLEHCKQLLARDGLLVIDVPYEPFLARDVALGRRFELPHHLFFTPWSLRHLLESVGFGMEGCELLNLEHTGVGVDPYCMLRAVCTNSAVRGGDSAKPAIRNYYRSIDALLGSFAGSIVFESDAPFGVFIYDPSARQLAKLFSERVGYRGLFTSNPDLDLDAANVFHELPEDIEYLISLTFEERDALRRNLKADVTIL